MQGLFQNKHDTKKDDYLITSFLKVIKSASDDGRFDCSRGDRVRVIFVDYTLQHLVLPEVLPQVVECPPAACDQGSQRGQAAVSGIMAQAYNPFWDAKLVKKQIYNHNRNQLTATITATNLQSQLTTTTAATNLQPQLQQP